MSATATAAGDPTSPPPPPPPSPELSLPKLRRPPWLIAQHVMSALVMREVKSRFGHNMMGYFWSVFEPVMQIIIMVIIFTGLGRKGAQGVPLPLFLLTGIFSWYMFRKIVSRIGSSIAPNIGLFSYHHVKVFDIVLVRLWIESLIYLSALAVLFGLFSLLGYDTSLHDPIQLAAVYLLFILFSMSIGMLNLMITTFFPITERFTSLLFRVMFFLSCVLFSLSDVPGEAQRLFLWNPMVHFLELLRVCYFTYYQTHGAIRFEGVFVFTLVTFYTAMALYRVNHARLVQVNLINRQGG
jgi:capsular polysaccharide transport system permease protein